MNTISYALKPVDTTEGIRSIGYSVGYELIKLTSAANVGMQYDDKREIVTFVITPARGKRISTVKVVKELEKHGEVAQVV